MILQSSYETETIYKMCVYDPVLNLNIFNNKMKKERFRIRDHFFPSFFFLSHTPIFGFALQGRVFDLAWQKRGISCYWKWFEGCANIALCSPVGCLSWQKMTNDKWMPQMFCTLRVSFKIKRVWSRLSHSSSQCDLDKHKREHSLSLAYISYDVDLWIIFLAVQGIARYRRNWPLDYTGNIWKRGFVSDFSKEKSHCLSQKSIKTNLFW